VNRVRYRAFFHTETLILKRALAPCRTEAMRASFTQGGSRYNADYEELVRSIL
jgi:hypothetical protein